MKLLEWKNNTKDQEICYSEFQSYILVDDELFTSKVPTTESIIAEIMNFSDASPDVKAEDKYLSSYKKEIKEPPLSIS